MRYVIISLYDIEKRNVCVCAQPGRGKAFAQPDDAFNVRKEKGKVQ